VPPALCQLFVFFFSFNGILKNLPSNPLVLNKSLSEFCLCRFIGEPGRYHVLAISLQAGSFLRLLSFHVLIFQDSIYCLVQSTHQLVLACSVHVEESVYPSVLQYVI